MLFDYAARTLFIMLQFEIKVWDGQRHTQLQLLLKNFSNYRPNQQKITNEHEVFTARASTLLPPGVTKQKL